MSSGLANLSARQLALLDQWLPGATVEKDHSWGLVQTTVLEMTYAGSRFIVKAGGESDHHLDRELRAHLNWLVPWTRLGRAPVLEHGDSEAKLLVTRYLPGELVLGSHHADAPATYREAGELLALLHAQTSSTDDDHEKRENDKSLTWLSGPHRIAPGTVERLRAEISSWPTPGALLVPTHGDWHPGTGSSTTASSASSTSVGRECVRPSRTSPGCPPKNSAAIRNSRQLSSTGTGTIRARRPRGTALEFARRSAPRPGPTG
ncbi:hypothetical protein GCM10027614_44160 [Micromonospora vulcania]